MVKYMHDSKCFHFFYVDNKRQKIERVCAQQFKSYHEEQKKKGVEGAKDTTITTKHSSIPHVPSLASLGSTLDTGKVLFFVLSFIICKFNYHDPA